MLKLVTYKNAIFKAILLRLYIVHRDFWTAFKNKYGLTLEKVCSLPITSLKAYSLMSNRGRSQNFQNLNFLHIFVALL